MGQKTIISNNIILVMILYLKKNLCFWEGHKLIIVSKFRINFGINPIGETKLAPFLSVVKHGAKFKFDPLEEAIREISRRNRYLSTFLWHIGLEYWFKILIKVVSDMLSGFVLANSNETSCLWSYHSSFTSELNV